MKVAVIGAGVSGLTALKACAEQGVDATCFEMHDNIGGIWYYTEYPREDENAVVHENLIANLSREMMRFSDFHFPDDCPPFPRLQHVFQYLHSYADKYNLKPKILLNTKVVSLKKAEDYEGTGRWVIKTQKVGESSVVTQLFDAVMYCIGYNKKPITPEIEGFKDFMGTSSHSKTYRTGKIYKNQRVLVIGNANSACDAAVGISDYAKQVYLSIGRGNWIYPRYADKMPIDTVNYRRMYAKLPNLFLENKLQRIADNYYNNKDFGLRPNDRPSKLFTAVNDDLCPRIACGKIKVLPRTVRFLKNGVQFEGHKSVHDIDHILFATGFKPDFCLLATVKKFGYSTGVTNDTGLTNCGHLISPPNTGEEDYVMNAYKKVFPVNLTKNTLAMIGMISITGAMPPTAEMQARFASLVFASKHKLPSRAVMIKDVNRWNSLEEKMFGPGKHRCPSLPLRDEIAAEIGVKPNFTSLLFKSPSVAFQTFFGPAFVAQYRLQGEGAIETAFEDCKRAWEITSQGVKLRKVPTFKDDTTLSSVQILSYLVLTILTIIVVFLTSF